MKRKIRSNKEKAEIVLAGTKGMKVSIICNQYSINQSQYVSLKKIRGIMGQQKLAVPKNLKLKTKRIISPTNQDQPNLISDGT